jgi:putative flippase GtrA
MKSPLASKPETARETRCGTRVTSCTGRLATDRNDGRWTPVVPGPTTAFARFVLGGGGVGVASSAAVSLCAALMPWVVANALITAASTVLCTELHSRFTFGAGRRAGWRRHWQSAGSAAAAYAVTCAAMAVLHMVRPSPGIFSEQAVYLSAAGLAGTGRFLVLRLFVFADSAHDGTRIAAPDQGRRTGRAVPGIHAAASGDAVLTSHTICGLVDRFAPRPHDDTAGALFGQLAAREKDVPHPHRRRPDQHQDRRTPVPHRGHREDARYGTARRS